MKSVYKIKPIAVLFFLLSFQFIQAQIVASGTVVSSEDKQPIAGASVIEKGTGNGLITDADGNFTLTVAKGATLVFSYVGS